MQETYKQSCKICKTPVFLIRDALDRKRVVFYGSCPKCGTRVRYEDTKEGTK